MRYLSAAAAMSAFVLASPVSAEETGRYVLQKSETGYVRMDTQTGDMSICEERDGQLVCKLAADERTAFQDEVERLQDRIEAVEARIVAIEANPLLNPKTLLPSEEEFEKSLSYMEKFFRRFMGVVKDLENEADDATPQKT